MAVETFTSTIEGKKFSYTQMPASKSILMKLRLGKILGPALPHLIESFGKDDGYQFALFLRIIEKVMSSNEPEVVLDLIQDLASMLFVDGSKCNFDVDFTGCVGDLYKVLFWLLKKEYGSFFGSLVKSEPAKEKEATSSATQPD